MISKRIKIYHRFKVHGFDSHCGWKFSFFFSLCNSPISPQSLPFTEWPGYAPAPQTLRVKEWPQGSQLVVNSKRPTPFKCTPTISLFRKAVRIPFKVFQFNIEHCSRLVELHRVKGRKPEIRIRIRSSFASFPEPKEAEYAEQLRSVQYVRKLKIPSFPFV